MLNHDMGHGGVYCDQASVSGVSQFVQSPDGVIPSLVRLEASKYRNDFGRYVAAKLTLDDCFFEFSFAVPDNEGCPFWTNAARSCGRRVSDLIERRAEIDQGVECDVAPVQWDGFCRLDFVDLVKSIGIVLHDNTVRTTMRTTIEETPYLSVKLGNVRVRSNEPAFRTEEWMIGFKEFGCHEA